MSRSLLDPGQIIQSVYNDATGGLNTTAISGTLVDVVYDYQEIDYVTSGNGIGQPEEVRYYQGGSGGTLVLTLQMTYNAQDLVATVTKI